MSITENKPPAHKPGSRTGPQSHRPILIGVASVIVALVAVLVVAIGVWVGRESKDGTSAVPGPGAPLTLPDKISGYAAAESDTDFATQPIWQDRAKAAAPNATVSGRSYGSAQLRRQIRVVAGRADLTDKLEFAWAADAGKAVESGEGTAHCTQNLKLVERSAAAVRPTMMFCSRITPGLSAYAVIIDFDHHPTDVETVAALDATWKAALVGR